MITVFNRKELIVTMEMNRQAEVRDILSKNNIEYIINTVNLEAAPIFGNRRAQIGSFGINPDYSGSFGINPDYSYEYKIYVHKKDYEKAAQLIR